jgi:hypothetical protein
MSGQLAKLDGVKDSTNPDSRLKTGYQMEVRPSLVDREL